MHITCLILGKLNTHQTGEAGFVRVYTAETHSNGSNDEIGGHDRPFYYIINTQLMFVWPNC